MSIENSLRTFILADSTISGLIGTRLYTRELPQNPTLPAMTCHRDDTIDNYHSTGNSGLSSPSFIFECYDDLTINARILAKALKDRIDGYRGVMTPDYVQSVMLENEFDNYDSELKKPYREAEYRFWYRESVSGEIEYLTESGELLLAETGEQLLATQ